jgi:hypothetical protein
MSLEEILEALPSLTPTERLTVIEAALELMWKELPQQEQQPAMSAEQQRALARERLLRSMNEKDVSSGLLQKIFRVFTG